MSFESFSRIAPEPSGAVAFPSLLLGAMLCGLVVSCVPDGPGASTIGAQELDEIEPTITGEIADGAGRGTGRMDGTWVKVHENSGCLALGTGNEVLSYSYYLVEMEQDGNAVYETKRLCHVDTSPVLEFRPIIPPEALASIRFPTIDHGFVSTAGMGGSYSSATEISLWGISLRDPLFDPIPDNADDDRVIDGDGDGNPGVTFEMASSGCERYVSQRAVSRYRGTFTSPNRIEGGSTTVTETETLGSTGLCGINIAVLPNDQISRFVMLRADGDNTNLDLRDEEGVVTCEQVNQVRSQLYPRRDPVRANCPRR